MDHIQSIGFYFSFVPLELRGFLIATVLVVQAIALYQVLKVFRRPRRYKAAAAAKPVSPRDRAKAREAALAEGFIVDDVERDMPDEASGLLRRVTCAHYYFPERIWARASWVLYRRPGAETGGLAPGWVFHQLEGMTTTPESFSAIAGITADDRPPRGVFEIESRDNFLHFYWDEAGGKSGVARFKDYINRLKNLS